MRLLVGVTGRGWSVQDPVLHAANPKHMTAVCEARLLVRRQESFDPNAPRACRRCVAALAGR